MNETAKPPLFLSYYGDDFTGSADVMEALEAFGISTVLYLEAPTLEQVHNFRFLASHKTPQTSVRAFGVAGISRTMSPSEMKESLPLTFERMAQIPCEFFHYKICSTFDSSPEIGNIGVATDIAINAFGSSCVPLVVGAPALGRFCVFGNLFARVGEDTFRLDRHPTMSRHPITPMQESDLRVHLSRLSSRELVHFDLSKVEGIESGKTLEEEVPQNGEFLLFDILEERHLCSVGKWLVEKRADATQVLVGSSGVEYALGEYKVATGELARSETPVARTVEQLIVLAGSASPGTSEQIDHALSLGFVDLRINTVDLVDPLKREHEIARCVDAASLVLESGRSPLLYAARGPDDPCIERTKQACERAMPGSRAGEQIASSQGEILQRLLDRVGKQRVLVAGGDTSGFASQALGIEALELLCPLAPGAPLCLAHSSNTRIHGLEICLKGGQNGNRKFFESVLKGRLLS